MWVVVPVGKVGRGMGIEAVVIALMVNLDRPHPQRTCLECVEGLGWSKTRKVVDNDVCDCWLFSQVFYR